MTSEPKHRELWIIECLDGSWIVSKMRPNDPYCHDHFIKYEAFLAVKAELEHFKNEMLQYKYEYENVCSIGHAAESELALVKAERDKLKVIACELLEIAEKHAPGFKSRLSELLDKAELDH